MKRYILLLISLLITLQSAYSQEDFKNLPVKDIYGNSLTLNDLIQDKNPMLWFFIKPGDAFTNRHLEVIKNSINLWQSSYGVKTVFLSTEGVEKTREAAIEGKWKVPVLCLPDSRIVQRFEFSGFPAYALFNGEKRLKWKNSGMAVDTKPFWDELAKYITKLSEQENGKEIFEISPNFMDIYATIGQPSSSIIKAIGLPRVVSSSSFDGKESFTYYYGGGIGLAEHLNSLSLEIKGGKVEKISFGKEYTGPLGPLAINASESIVKTWLGEGELIMEDIGGYSFKHPVYFYPDWGMTIEYNDYMGRSLFDLSISKPKNPRLFLDHLKKVKGNLGNILSLTQPSQIEIIWGKPQKTETNEQWDIHYYLDQGFAYWIEKSASKVFWVTLFGETLEGNRFKGELPYQLRFNHSEQEVYQKLGKPDQTQETDGPVTMVFNQKGIIINYDKNSSQIRDLTVKQELYEALR